MRRIAAAAAGGGGGAVRVRFLGEHLEPRRKLRQLDNWTDWENDEMKQLDQMDDLKMFGEPCKAPPNAIVLRAHWNYRIKPDGSRPRYCCDGSPNAAPHLPSAALQNKLAQ